MLSCESYQILKNIYFANIYKWMTTSDFRDVSETSKNTFQGHPCMSSNSVSMSAVYVSPILSPLHLRCVVSFEQVTVPVSLYLVLFVN